jgi:hypothetical protein
MKKRTLTWHKNKAWDAFSLFIRTRDWKKYEKKHPEYNGEPVAVCVTCDRLYPIKKLQAGHFIPGRTNAVLFDERGVNSQCYGCNVGKGGNYHNYWLFMEREYGREVVDELLSQRQTTLKMKAFEFDELTELYKKKLAGL